MTVLQTAFESRNKKQNKIEKIKSAKNTDEALEQLKVYAESGYSSIAKDDIAVFFKYFGLFDKKKPNGENHFMLRVRIPAGQLNVEQTQKIGELSEQYGNDYIDITTRQQIEFRYLKIEDVPAVLEGLNSVGITTYQTGIDNFRNIVTSSFDGLGTKSIIEVKPIIDELQSIFMYKEDWIGTLPRKFNTAILGATTNDCNIYGHDCCFVVAKQDEQIGFNLYLGGRVGIQASDTGLFISQEQVLPTFEAIINLFKTYGFRDNRNKNRLHFLLEAVGMEAFVSAIKEQSGLEYASAGEILATEEYTLDESGVFELDSELKAVHFSIPSGVFKGSDLKRAALVAKEVDGLLRLSVEQSFYIVTSSDKVETVQSSELFKEYSSYHNIYFNHQIACAGTETCSFGVIPNKPDAVAMANFLQKEVPIAGGKVRMYWSACPKGCGIHGIADIGFEGCKATNEAGEKVDGVHVFLGGKATLYAGEARMLYKALPMAEAQEKVKALIELYRDEREESESFEMFESRVLSGLSSKEIEAKIEEHASKEVLDEVTEVQEEVKESDDREALAKKWEAERKEMNRPKSFTEKCKERFRKCMAKLSEIIHTDSKA